MSERDRPHRTNHAPPDPLPPDLATFLASQRRACLLIGTERGSGFIIKAPEDEIASTQSSLPVLLRHELYRHPAAPVIRLVLRFYDGRPDRPPMSFPFESFVDVDDERQRQAYGDLARQELIDLSCYDDRLRHRLTRPIPNTLRADIPLVLTTARRLRARIADDCFYFNQAKADVIARTSL